MAVAHAMDTARQVTRWRHMPDVARASLLAASYLVVAKFSLSMGAVGGVAAPVWPPTGMALAALLLGGARLWPGVAAGAFLANWSVGVPVLAAIGIAAGNTLEAVVGSYVLRRADFQPSLERLRDVLSLMVLAAGASTLLSAAVGVTSSWLGGVIGAPEYGIAWWTWWVGDAMGDVVVASALLVWSAPPFLRRPATGWIEAAALVSALVIVATLVFGSLRGDQYFGGAYAVFPFVIWAAVRFSQRGATLAIALVSALAIRGTVYGLGPFARPGVYESLLLLQTFMAVVATTALVLGATIAERRRAAAALSEGEERYRRLVEISPDAITLTDLDGNIMLCNEQAAALQGYTRDELGGRNVLALLVEADRPRAWGGMRQVLKTGSLYNLEYTLLKKDGTTCPAELSASVLLNRAGKPQGFITVGRDISARKQAETNALRLSAIVESSADAIVGKTLDGTITTWNAAAEKMYGYAAAEIIGQPISLLAPTAVDEIVDILAKLEQGAQIRDYETLRFRKDGKPIHVSLTISPIRNAAGQTIGASTIARDISDRKALEQLRADFIASLTHDIRGPVANIGGYLELLRAEPGLSTDVREIIAVMESSVHTTFSLITNYLQRARIEAGRLSLSKTPVALNDLLIRVARQYEVIGVGREIAVALRLQPQLPPVDGDALALERVFGNLVHNAFKFSPDSGRITICTWEEDHAVAVSVADTGPGIPPEDIPVLFERYQQTATGRSQPGTGLGLFIAKSLVEAHGGVIRVESDDSGSCFTVVLPLPTTTAASAPPVAAAR